MTTWKLIDQNTNEDCIFRIVRSSPYIGNSWSNWYACNKVPCGICREDLCPLAELHAGFAKCEHPDHNSETNCLDRAVGCNKHCVCCMGELAVPIYNAELNSDEGNLF